MNANNSLKTLGLFFFFLSVLLYLPATSPFFIVDQTQYAIKIRLGDPVEIYKAPGLYFKAPMITRIFYVDNRLMNYDSEPGAVLTKDKKEMMIDNFAKWRVTDPLKYYETVIARGVDGAQSLLDDVIYSQLREVVGRHTLSEVVSGMPQTIRVSQTDDSAVSSLRREIMSQITLNARKSAESFGIELVDLRIKRADLPEANSLAVYGRMEAERRRDAKRYRSEGEEEALKLRSDADRERVEILAKAQREAEEIRGTADAAALKIYAAAYQKDADFFQFQRSHDAYREILKQSSTFVMSSDRKFFEHLK